MKTIRAIAALAALVAATPAMAAWVRFAGNSATATFSYDDARIQMDGQVVRVWVRMEGPAVRQRAARLESLQAFDCVHRTSQVIRTLSYDDAGRMTRSDDAATVPQSFPPASHSATLFGIVCAPRQPET